MLDEIVKRYGQKSAGQLRNLTHQHAAWKDCDEQEMDYRKFFDGAPAAARAMLELPAARGA